MLDFSIFAITSILLTIFCYHHGVYHTWQDKLFIHYDTKTFFSTNIFTDTIFSVWKCQDSGADMVGDDKEHNFVACIEN